MPCLGQDKPFLLEEIASEVTEDGRYDQLDGLLMTVRFTNLKKLQETSQIPVISSHRERAVLGHLYLMKLIKK